jgi:predicted nucleic acid-binding protein
MNEENLLFDTYALFEIMNNNPNYSKYLEKRAIINDFIFAELCYNLIKDKAKNVDEILGELKFAIIHAKPEWIKEAMQFRLKWKDRKVSMADCVSYIMSKKLEIKFLTGDKEFENLENVEFVK